MDLVITAECALNQEKPPDTNDHLWIVPSRPLMRKIRSQLSLKRKNDRWLLIKIIEVVDSRNHWYNAMIETKREDIDIAIQLVRGAAWEHRPNVVTM